MSSFFNSPNFKNLLDNLTSNQSGQLSPIVDLYKNPFREKEREHIEAILARLPNHSYVCDIERRLLSTTNYLGAWYELMVYDWLYELEKTPIVQPLAPDGRTKPDFFIKANGTLIFIDVASVQGSKKDENVGEIYNSVRVWWPEDENTAIFKTMRERLLNKIGKHRSITKEAYVICLGLETPWIDSGAVKTCFIGTESFDPVSGRLRQKLDGEIFEKEENDFFLVKHLNISALLVARHSGVSEEEGYKLVFELIQNPYARIRIHDTEFGEIRRFVVVSESDSYFEMGWQY